VSDNFHIDVRSAGEEDLLLCLKILFHRHGSFERSYRTHATVPTLVFQWSPSDGYRPPDAPIITNVVLTPERAVPVILAWLDGVDYGRGPDHDGDNTKGWRVFNDPDWCHVLGDLYGAFGIQPCWMMHGK
jgi:hypothetical protein